MSQQHPGDGAPANRLVAAVYDPVTWVAERALFRSHREYLASDLGDRVLDLGAGTGGMFEYFADPPRSDPPAALHAIEPDPHMRKRAAKRADRLDLDVELRSDRAESLPYADDSFETVVASMVFCTIADVNAAIEEVGRVLEPGGELRFLEHVVDDGWRRELQRTIAPIWRRLAGGCHLTRRTHATFAADPAFEVVELERLSVGVTPVRPFVRGRLERRHRPIPSSR